jgi:hypothetical protein
MEKKTLKNKKKKKEIKHILKKTIYYNNIKFISYNKKKIR